MRVAVFVAAVLASPLASAIGVSAGADLVWTHIAYADNTWHSPVARGRLAVDFTPELSLGVYSGGGLDDDLDAGTTLEIDTMQAGYLRYAASLDENTALALTLGYGETELAVTGAAPAGMPATGDEGFQFALVLEERLRSMPAITAALSFERWLDSDGLTVDAISYGFRYGF